MKKNATTEDIVKAASAELGYPSLKDKQLLVISEFHDVFTALPTGKFMLWLLISSL